MTAAPRRPGDPMHVVHVVRQFAPAIGGLEEAVLKLCLALRDRGVGVSVVTLDRISRSPARPLGREDTVRGVPVRRIPFHGSWRYPVAPQVLRHLARADVVHVHAVDFFFDFLALTRPLHRKPLVASTHGGFFHTAFARRLKQAYFHTVTRGSARAYSAICASSRSDYDLFGSIASRNLRLAENGVDTTKWSGLSPPMPQRHLLAIGRFASNKGLPKLVDLLRDLRKLHPAWALTLAGRTWDVEAEDLRRVAAASGVGDALHILPDPSDDEIVQAIAQASYIVSASSHEGFGLGVVEGMAAGLVPVLNRIPPFQDLISRAGCGFLIDADDPCAAARDLERLHAAESGSDRLRAASIRAAGAHSWTDAADRFVGIYREAIGLHARASHLEPHGLCP